MGNLYLDEIREGTHAKILKIESGCDAKNRLNHLGLTPGTEIQLVSAAPFKGPILIKFRDTQICIGRGLAKKILVEKF